MPDLTIYHNPRCSKSRRTLALLEEHGAKPTVIRYLDTPPDAGTLAALTQKLGLCPADLLRRKEPAFKDLGLAEKLDDDATLLAAMATHPALIERPIVVRGDQARLGRPPENVLDLLPPEASPAQP